MNFNMAKMKKCMKYGHDWAIKDEDRFMLKICLRCGAEQYFFAYEEEDLDADMDDDSTKTL